MIVEYAYDTSPFVEKPIEQVYHTLIEALVLAIGSLVDDAIVVVALILTPGMCARLLKPTHDKTPIGPLRWFNGGLDRLTLGYGSAVARFARRPFQVMVLLVGVGGGAWWVYDPLPRSFLQSEDQGVLMVIVELPQGATTQQTEHAVAALETHLLANETDMVESVFSNVGFSFGGSGQNYAMLFVKLKDWDARRDPLLLRDWDCDGSSILYFLSPKRRPACGLLRRFPSETNFPLLSFVVAGCAVGADYERPDIALQTRFVGGDAQAIQAVATQTWWRSYKDATLDGLIARGLAQNLDVLTATEAIRQAQAQLRATGVNDALGGSLMASHTRGGGDGINTYSDRSSTLGAGFVIDLFGGIQRVRESAVAGLGVAETARLAWLAELLAAYSDARYYQEVLALTRDTIRARAETLDITRSQFEAGAATEYEVAEVQALLSTARAALPQYAALFDAQVYAIATLLNEPAGPIQRQIQKGAPQLRTPGGGNTGVPADLLRNRPDVRSAEPELAMAVAGLGVAEAALYASLFLTGSVGRSESANSWSFGPALSIPVFNQGSLRANRDAELSAAKQAEIVWRASILGAVEDVQVAQSNLTRYRQRATLLRRAAQNYGRALSLAQENYRNGALTLLDLLETDRDTANARISAASAVNDAAQAWATLKIATGAGAAATAAGTH